jgi:hypothetical protein
MGRNKSFYQMNEFAFRHKGRKAMNRQETMLPSLVEGERLNQKTFQAHQEAMAAVRLARLLANQPELGLHCLWASFF